MIVERLFLLKSIAENQVQDKTINLEQVRENQVMQKKNITCMDDKAITTIDFCGQAGKAMNPFDDQTPRQILTRQYKVYESQINSSWPGDNLKFPDCLLQQQAIINALSTFFFIRADVEISVRINATPYHAGMMMLSWYPDGEPGAGDDTLMRRSGMSPVCLNYSTSESVELKFHWVDPQTWVFINSGDSPNFALGTLNLDPLVPVANTSGGNENIYCTIYARFIEPKTAGFQPLAPPGFRRVAKEQSTMGGLFEALKPTPQPVDPEAQAKSTSSTVVTTAPRLSLRPIFKDIPMVGDVYDQVSSIVKTVADFLDKPRSLQFAHKMQMDWNSDLVNGSGQDASTRMSLYPQSSLATQGIFNKMCHTSQYSIAQLCGVPMIHEIYVFNNTNTSFQVGVHPGYVGGTNFVSAHSLQPDYLMWISSNFRFWRGSIKYYFMFVTDGFTTARFRISYFIDPATPAGYTASGGDFPSVIVDVKGTTVKSLIVPYLFELPWRKVQEEHTGDASETLVPGLRVEQLVAPTASVGESQITCVLWRAGGEDLQFQQLQSSSIQTQTSAALLTEKLKMKDKAKDEPKDKERPGVSLLRRTRVANPQCSVQGLFNQKFDSMGCDSCGSVESGFTSSEGTGPLVDCLRRYCGSGDFNGDYNVGWYLQNAYSTASDQSWRYPLYALQSIFKFWRGSVRTKTPLNVLDTMTMNGDLAANGDYGDGHIWTFIPGTGMPLQFEIPYYSTVPWQVTGVNNSYLNYDNATLAQGGRTNSGSAPLVSVGDDYLAAVLFTPPAITTPSSEKKT